MFSSWAILLSKKLLRRFKIPVLNICKAMSVKVSIIMPVYNAEAYLQAALDSLYAQSLSDFEILAINDGSTDGSAQILSKQTDKRLIVLTNDHNQGLSFSLNRGLQAASGDYLARMDADDLSDSRRLAAQVNFLDAHPAIDLCGTCINLIDSAGLVYGQANYPRTDEAIKATMIFSSPFAHPSVMFRRHLLNNHDCYYRAMASEDYDLWQRLSVSTTFANLPEYLLNYRSSVGISSNALKTAYQVASQKIRSALLEKYFSSPPFVLPAPGSIYDQVDIDNYRQWLRDLDSVNQAKSIFSPAIFRQVLAREWFSFLRSYGNYQPFLSPKNLSANFYFFSQLSWREELQLLWLFLKRLK